MAEVDGVRSETVCFALRSIGVAGYDFFTTIASTELQTSAVRRGLGDAGLAPGGAHADQD